MAPTRRLRSRRIRAGRLRARRLRVGWALAAALGLCIAAGASAEPPRRYERLRPDEAALAVERADAARRSRAPDRAAARAAEAGAPSVGSPELLQVERHQRSKRDRARGLGRSADVFHYDYERNVTIHTVVRLPSGEVESIEERPEVQMPLTENEIARASGIALADAAVRERIGRVFRQHTGEVLENLDQLHAKAMVFSAESMPDTLNPASRRCGEHRCAQLLLFTADHVTVEVIPIVDLSTGELVQVLDF